MEYDDELEDNYSQGPPNESFIDLNETFRSLMSYRSSRNANAHKIRKRGRILREIKQFQFIQFDLQNCLMSNERRQIQKEALFAAQRISYLSDPQEIQQDQTNQPRQFNSFRQGSQNANESFTSNWVNNNDDDDDDFFNNTSKNYFANLRISPSTRYNDDQNNNGNAYDYNDYNDYNNYNNTSNGSCINFDDINKNSNRRRVTIPNNSNYKGSFFKRSNNSYKNY